MSNLTVYVKSCARDRDLGFHTAIRETWGAQLKLLGVETYFCTADPMRLEMCDGDEVNFQFCRDDYMGLPYKTHRICSWASHKYKPMIYLCDNDTLINPLKLVGCLNDNGGPLGDQFDYAGYFCQGASEVGKTFYYRDHMGEYPNCDTWCSGGVGYFLSWRATSMIALTLPQVWAEDMYVGQVLGPLIRSGDIKARALPLDKNVAWHFRKSRGNPVFTPELLREIYAKGGPDAFYAK